ncbi:MAG: oligosaccharide flippase family protein, partial [Clostridia bacterium]|nr:oligosaccharide flippase family protein [Clostridia bacterium]
MRSVKEMLQSKRGTLLKNTVMLYILQFSTYVLALAVAPYQTRVLGAEVFGGFLEASASIVIYFQLIIDFGFLLSATEEVSKKRGDKAALSGILSSVTAAKLLLSALSFLLLFALCHAIPAWEQKKTVLLLTFVASFLNSMMPDFLYRGLERMSAITVRTVLIKVFFTFTVFLFLKGPEDVWVVPTLNIIANGVSLILAYLHVILRLGVRLVPVRFSEVTGQLSRSAFFFFSRIAT